MSNRENYTLAIDLGTQSVRAALVDPRGEIRWIAQAPQEVDSPYPGWAQQRPESWWRLTCGVTREVLSKSGISPRSIVAVCSCGHMHGPVGIDEAGNVTTEWTQLWCDKRCETQCEAVRAEADEDALARATANPITPGWVGLKVRWIRENQPDAYRAARWFLVPKDFINFRLTDVAATDPSEASGSYLWDAEKDGYSEALAETVGVALTKFAPSFASHEVIGAVTERAAAETGLLSGTPVVAGGGDFLVSLLGLGVVDPNTAVDITGTSTLLVVHKEKPLVHPAIQNLRHVLEGWVPFIMLDCGGLSVKWCRDVVSSAIGREIAYEELIEMAKAVPVGSEGLLFYPYMLGERRPENTAARGGFFGITLNHTSGHFVRAVMEGVALALGMSVRQFTEQGVDIHRVLCVGGGARNALLNQIKADLFGVPIELIEEPEASLRGAGLLGALGAGLVQNVTPVARQIREGARLLSPDPKSSARYESLLDDFIRLYDRMLGFWQKES